MFTVSTFSPVLIVLYLDHGNSLLAGFLASSLASLQTNFQTFVKVSELSKIQIANGFFPA